MSEEIVMSPDTAPEAPDWFTGRLARKINLRLVGCGVGLALALLIAPTSRRLFLAQAGLTIPMPMTVASFGGSQVGLHPDPFYGDIAIPAAHAAARRAPDDLQMQIADACTIPSQDNPHIIPPGGEVPASVQKVRNMRALESRFGDRPSLYANILRYEAMGQVRPQHLAEQYALENADPPKPTPNAPDVKPLDTAEYAAYDRDAAQGERLDPDNAYFPFMRAIGLFGMNRDSEALAAITRAGHKSVWREYYNDELRGQWRLQDAASVNNSALFHTLSAAALLFPQYAQMRGAVRVTIYKAMQLEQTGQVREGLALREDVTRLGSLMRVQSASLIGALVGDALTDVALQRPGGLPVLRHDPASDDKERLRRAVQRVQFDAYLKRVGAADAAPLFHAAQQAGDDMQNIVRDGENSFAFDVPLHSLLLWWVADLLVLSNILWLLVAGIIAMLAGRDARIKAGLPLPLESRFALGLGLAGGGLAAPFLLPNVSPLFQNISGDDRTLLLFAGIVSGVIGLILTTKARAVRVRCVTTFAYALVAGVGLTGFYVWQMRGLAGIVKLADVFLNLSSASGSAGPALSPAVAGLTPGVLGLILLGLVTMSLACRVPLSVGLSRGLRGLMVPVSAILFLIYGVMLLFTLRAERTAQYRLERTVENEGQAIADLSGKMWPRADVTKNIVGQ